VRFADEDGSQVVRVAVRPTGVTYAGHLSIVGRSGRRSERDVEDFRCSAVVDALALVTALAVDPNALLSPRVAAASASAAPVQAPLEASGPEPTTVIPLIAPPPPPTPKPAKVVFAAPLPRAPESQSPPDRVEEAPQPRPRWRAGLGASFVTLAGIAPDTLTGGGGFVEIERESRRWLAPSVRLLGFAAENGAFSSPVASFLMGGGRMDLCPVRVGSPDLSLRACVTADLGAVRAEGLQVPAGGHGIPSVEAWFDAGALLRSRWVPGRGRLFVEAEGGMFVPVNRSTWNYTNPPSTVWTPWVVGSVGSLAMGVRL